MQLLKVYRRIKRKLNYMLSVKEINLKKPHKKLLVLMGGPEYGNLGDHAIAYATQKFAEKNLLKYDYVELTENDILYNIKKIKNMITTDDILLLQGGGNTGDLYPDQEKVRKVVLQTFPNNKIILMPQTIYFKENAHAEVYYNREGLVMCARESKSYDIMNEIYSCNILLIPDMVFSLFHSIPQRNVEREGALICLRDDCEKNKDSISAQKLLNVLNEKKIKSKFISTVKNYEIKKINREKELEELFEQFRSAQIIFTDRLHGMIFAAITKTPCVVFPTFNHKVTESYSWIEELGYICLCDNFDYIDETINYVLSHMINDKMNFEEKFEPLIMEMNANEKIY